ncbi:PWWP domain-containing protein 2A isoform X1 [Dipodomys merriami]|uniref:PWWP domain-containing protein 2A isoform X1 n=1 Tax=Dipodomys merriami TaxID=94247 RepID=UPI0038560240
MAAVAAEAAATAASPGEGGAGEAEPELEPIPGSEAGTDPLPVTATEAAVPAGEADGRPSAPQADAQPPPPPPGEPARSPEAAGPELEAEEKPPARAAAAEAAAGAGAPPEGPGLLPSRSPAPPPARDEREETPRPPPPGVPGVPGVPALVPPAGGGGAVAQLIPGAEVRVTLDHIIEDALVVSFRRGDKLFSGVLMDLSKRFGPHGIPVTVFPRRESKERPEARAPGAGAEAALGWTGKPPPLFHEGAPYPPPLFIRDTYNQAIPQPPPRKIKRPKRKLYREEPTSIMNAIKLRPRQVLCEKCKNSVAAERREARRGAGEAQAQAQAQARCEERKRRSEAAAAAAAAAAGKKLKGEPKVDGRGPAEGPRRGAVVKVPGLGPGRARVVRVPAQAAAAAKVLQSKNMDHAKAREVLKMAKEKAQKKPSESSSSRGAHAKAHLSRRYQSPGAGALPPRVRLKPQRYRNEENDSSLKTGLERVRSGKLAPKPPARCSSSRAAGESPARRPRRPQPGPRAPRPRAGEAGPAAGQARVPGAREPARTLGARGGRGALAVFVTLHQKPADSCSASVCSLDSADDLRSSSSEASCSSESFAFPPGGVHAPPAPAAAPAAPEEDEAKPGHSLKMRIFSKNVSKCITPDGRTLCVGDIVWAKIYGFPWWPARILSITVSRRDNGLLARQEARLAWFGSPTTSSLALSQLSPFLENFQARFNKKRKGLYRKAITEAAKAARQLTPEVRALLTQFET